MRATLAFRLFKRYLWDMTILDWIILAGILVAVMVLVERFIRWIIRKERRRSEEDE